MVRVVLTTYLKNIGLVGVYFMLIVSNEIVEKTYGFEKKSFIFT